MSDRQVATAGLKAGPRPIFADALGSGFETLPAALRDLHDVVDERVFEGRADVGRGGGLLSRIAAALVGFPPAGRDIPVRVTMQRRGKSELWTRDFAGRRFRSWLSLGGALGEARVDERFGLIKLRIALVAGDGARLGYPVVRGFVLGVPLPRFLLPQSDTFEYVDADGRASFDVSISLPLAGHVASYRGWLVPTDHSHHAAKAG